MNIRIIVYYWFFRLRQTSCRKGQNRRKYCLPPLPPAPATVPGVARLVLPAIQLWAQLQWSPAPAPPAWLYTTLLGNINEHNIVNQTCRLLTSSQPALMWCAVQKMATENLQLARRLVRPHPCLSTEESHPDSVACASHARYRSCSSSSTLLREGCTAARYHFICLPCFLANVLQMFSTVSNVRRICFFIIGTLSCEESSLWQLNCWSMTDIMMLKLALTPAKTSPVVVC